MSLKFVPFIVQTIPENNATGVPLRADISVIFSTDMDPASFAGNFIVQMASGGKEIEGTITYNNRTLTFTPTSPFEPGTAYLVIIRGDTDFEDGQVAGIRSILQYPMAGVQTITFTTAQEDTLPAPSIQAPSDVVLADGNVVLKWTAVPGADLYEVEIGPSPRLDSLVWTSRTPSLTAVPDVLLTEGNYFWHVRAVDEQGRVGLWSETASFAIGYDSMTDWSYVPGETYHPFDPPEPQLQKPVQLYNVDPKLEEIVLFLPHGRPDMEVEVQLVGTSLSGNVKESHGEVPVEVTLESAETGVKLLVTSREEE